MLLLGLINPTFLYCYMMEFYIKRTPDLQILENNEEFLVFI